MEDKSDKLRKVMDSLSAEQTSLNLNTCPFFLDCSSDSEPELTLRYPDVDVNMASEKDRDQNAVDFHRDSFGGGENIFRAGGIGGSSFGDNLN